MADFKVGLRENSTVSIIDLNGYLDAHTAPELESAFTRLIEEKRYNIVVNFSELSYISSAGLGVFMAYVEAVRENDGDIKFCSMTPKVFSIFDLLGFPLLYEFFENEADAVQKYSTMIKH